jgi:putative aldouronate transport system permease protein
MPDNRRARAAVISTAGLWVLASVSIAFMLIAMFNPARVSELISKNASLFTMAVSYSTIGANFIRALSRGWITQGALSLTYIGAVVTSLGTVLMAASACVVVGKYRLKYLAFKFSAAAGVLGIAGNIILRFAYNAFANAPDPSRVDPITPQGLTVYLIMSAAILIFSVAAMIFMPKPLTTDKYEMEAKYRLFLMILPFLILVFIFSYLPLWGWRIAFYDYRAGFELTADSFVGFKWFTYLFQNAATRADIVRVLKNTFAMSGLGIATSWLPMAFAIFLSEIRSGKTKRVVQTLTTIPNFISWVLVYSVAFAIFSTEGFLNWMLVGLGVIENGTNYLMDSSHTWLKMWAWGTWKGLGWSAIVYIAGISGIDQQLYEAATVDGAGRFKRMWHITVPGLLSTFFVLLMLSIASILSNGMDQYLVFYNPATHNPIQVLDLYVYQLGLQQSSTNIPLATLIGMFKSVVSVTLLFAANKLSGKVRGESII